MGLLNEAQPQAPAQGAPMPPQDAKRSPTTPPQPPQGGGGNPDAALQQALDHIAKVLYQDDAATKIAEVLRDMGNAPQILAQIAYKTAQGADTATQGNVAEEDLAMLGAVALNEVLEIASEVGIDVTEALQSKVFKKMALIYAEDQGIDTAPIKKAFEKINDDEFGEFAKEAQNQELDEAAMEDDAPQEEMA